MPRDCLITESNFSYHSALLWDLKHGCLDFLCVQFCSLTHNASRLEGKKQALATKALIQSVSSSADPNPLTPESNV